LKLSKRIELMRLERKWSQRERGRRAGLGPQQINRYEREESQPSIEALKKIKQLIPIIPNTFGKQNDI
jgi:transcriptional regulator with XRE-family HTH domain